MEARLQRTAWHAPWSATQPVFVAAAVSLTVSVLLAGSLLLVRRILGAVTMPLGGWWLLASGVALAAAAWVVRWAWVHNPWANDNPPQAGAHSVAAWALRAMPSVASGLMLLSVSTPASGALPLVGAWLVWLASEAVAWYVRPATGLMHPSAGARDGGTQPPSPPQPAEEISLRATGSVPSSARPDAAAVVLPPRTEDDDTELIPPNLVQQVTRLLEQEGERVHALARVAIEAGDCLGVLHLAFGPPLTGHPELAACVLDEPQATARVTDAETFGARVEVRLSQPVSQSKAVWVEVHGLAPGRGNSAGFRLCK